MKRRKFLSMKEKEELAMKGMRVPICISGSQEKKSFIAKLRGTIFDGSLNNKKIRL